MGILCAKPSWFGIRSQHEARRMKCPTCWRCKNDTFGSIKATYVKHGRYLSPYTRSLWPVVVKLPKGCRKFRSGNWPNNTLPRSSGLGRMQWPGLRIGKKHREAVQSCRPRRVKDSSDKRLLMEAWGKPFAQKLKDWSEGQIILLMNLSVRQKDGWGTGSQSCTLTGEHASDSEKVSAVILLPTAEDVPYRWRMRGPDHSSGASGASGAFLWTLEALDSLIVCKEIQ